MADILLNNFLVREILIIMGRTWFLWLPVLSFLVLKELWRRYVRAHFIFSKKYILLDIKVPREVAKSPKAMESILAGLHGTRRLGNKIEQWWDGWITAWFSLEIVGDTSGVHFYIWTQEFFKRVIESQIYAQYPAAEIRVVEDYVKDMPPAVPDKDWNIWGSELTLTKPDAFPIKTYEEFTLEDISTKEEQRKIDPLSALIEWMGVLKGSEKMWVQMLIEPADDTWKKEGEALIGKMIGKRTKTKPSFISGIIGFIDSGIFGFLFGGGTAPAPKKSDAPPSQILYLSPGESEVVKSIERNMAKLGFKVCIRWIYLAKRDEFNMVAVPAVMGIFKQFASQNLNSFGLNKRITTSVDYWLVNYRNAWRKNRLFNSYRMRSVFHPPYKTRSKPFVLSTSELATVYHFPGEVVSAPAMERIEAKRGAPPANLPI